MKRSIFQGNLDEEEKFNQVFGDILALLSEECKNILDRIRNRDITEDSLFNCRFSLGYDDEQQFTIEAWEQLGRYIANNRLLKSISLDGCDLPDEKVTLLFKGLGKRSSLLELDLDANDFGINGVRSMLPLLQRSPDLEILHLGKNTNFNTECFELLIGALDESNIESISVGYCNIEDISVLDRYDLPNLEYLQLNGSNIGREGCITLSNLLQKEGSKLERADLEHTDIDDEGAEILAHSLKNNTKMKHFLLRGCKLKEKGYTAFLKLIH